MKRPNTIAGLQAKRAELSRLHTQLVAETKKVTCDLDHIDACIRLFDPDADAERTRINRYATKHRAPKGQMTRFVMEQFRLAAEPITSRQITAAWAQDRGLEADESTFVILRRRVGACLVSLKNNGTIESVGMDGACKLWRLVAD